MRNKENGLDEMAEHGTQEYRRRLECFSATGWIINANVHDGAP